MLGSTSELSTKLQSCFATVLNTHTQSNLKKKIKKQKSEEYREDRDRWKEESKCEAEEE